jgi:hypothetical protein
LTLLVHLPVEGGKTIAKLADLQGSEKCLVFQNRPINSVETVELGIDK